MNGHLWPNDHPSRTSMSHPFPKASQILPPLAWLVAGLGVQSTGSTANPRAGQDMVDKAGLGGGHGRDSTLDKLGTDEVANGWCTSQGAQGTPDL